MKEDTTHIDELLRASGLVVLGAFDGAALEDYSVGRKQLIVRQVVLVGNAGSAMWPAFTGSVEYNDGLPNPLDRWSRRIGMSVAAELGADVVFPFEGPPYPPVLDWAERTGQAFKSPISMFIHQEYGLWHAYRFALLPGDPLCGINPPAQATQPCLSCEDQPCLHACPVDAFNDKTYHVDSCVDYLAADPLSNCRQLGCSARKACPFGIEFQYQAGHARFHMNAFLKSQTSSKT